MFGCYAITPPNATAEAHQRESFLRARRLSDEPESLPRLAESRSSDASAR